jgi:hypothetical protein
MKTNNSAMQEEQVDFLNGDFSQTVDELNKLSEMDTIQIVLNEGLEEALKELDSLHDQFSKGCCRSVQERDGNNL